MDLPEHGLHRHQIAAIYPITYTKQMGNLTDKSKQECDICLVDFKEGDMVKSLQCLHFYHSHCIDDWLHKKSICPNCKFNMIAIDFDQLI